MDEKRKQLLDRISKLLSLADSTTFSEERAAAKKMIAKLLAEYGLKLSDIRSGDEIISKLVEERYKNINNIDFDLFVFIAEFSGCYVFFRQKNRNTTDKYKSSYVVTGRACDIEAALYLRDVIKRQMLSLCKVFNSVEKNRIKRNSYKQGIVLGVRTYLKEITSEVIQYQKMTGLVPVNEFETRSSEAERYVKNKNPNMKESKSDMNIDRIDRSAFRNGVHDAKNIKIHAPVGAKDELLSIS